ncbi:MAG: hypothetical protein QNJ84_03490 [Alphaproteobacteria bacterium]|nr:hypothetical protein [Alphaproteobacteria bacterium]
MRAIALIFCCLAVAACGAQIKAGDKSYANREIRPGPGVFSGDDGEFVIFRVEDDAPKKE